MTTLVRILALSTMLACTGLSASGCGPPPQPASALAHALSGKPLPDFDKRTLGGARVDTKSLRGRVVVVKFFAKYCEPCKRTLPAIEKLHRDDPEIAVVGVAEDESQADAAEVVATYGLSFPVVHDAGNVLAGRYRVSEMPITFVADAEGRIRWIGGPAQSEDDLPAAIASAK